MIHWATGRRSVLVVCRYDGPEPDLVARLQPVYAGYFGPSCQVTVRRVPELGLSVAVVGSELVALSELGVWGDCVGEHGDVTTNELQTTPVRDLLGSFVVVRQLADRLRLEVAPDLLHALRHSTGLDGEAWSSHGLAAVLACGGRPAVVPDRIPELTTLDYVLGDDDLLAGVRVLPEAAVVEITSTGATEVDSWPVRERMLARHDVTLPELRAAIGSVLVRLARVPGLQLALTAGRDSTLLAGCFDELGVAVPSFTFGGLDSPDGAGASAVAAELGWVHHCLQPEQGKGGSVERLLATTLWSEGLDTAWNAYGPPLIWPAEHGSAHLYGIGGEMGRAYYWSTSDPSALADPAALMTHWLAKDLHPVGGELLNERGRAFVEALSAQGWEGPGLLDGWHARGRVRKWPGHTPLPAGVLAGHTAYTSAPVAGMLLGMPVQQRIGGVGFDAAARLHRDLLAVARAAPVIGSRRPPSRLARLRRHPSVSLAVQARRDLSVAGSPVLEVFGKGWWKELEKRIPHEQATHRYMWNSLAVEALASVVQSVPVERAFLSP